MNGKYPFECIKCSKRFRTQKALRQHYKRRHTNKLEDDKVIGKVHYTKEEW